MNPSEVLSIEALISDDGWLRPLVAHLVEVHEVDDLIQETRLAALERAPQNLDSPRAWVVTVARNFAYRMRRSRTRRHEREQRAARPEGQRSTAELAERIDAQRRVSEAVLGLTEPYRSAVLLRYYEGLNATQIGERLGVPAATVRSRLQRGLERIREQVAGDLGPDWRSGYAILLLPRAKPVVTTTGAQIFSRALIMTTVLKAGIPVSLALLAAYLLWNPTDTRSADAAGESIIPEIARPTIAIDSPKPTAETGQVERSILAPRHGSDTELKTIEFRGRVLDYRGRPLSGVPIGVENTNEEESPDRDVLAVSDHLGEFVLTTSAKFTGSIIATGDDFMTLHSFPVDASDRDKELILVVAPAVRVSGRIYDERGQPLSGIKIDIILTVLRGFPVALDRTQRTSFDSYQSDANGHFSLPRIPATPQASIRFFRNQSIAASRPCPRQSSTGFDIVLRDPTAGEPELVGIVIDGHGQLLPHVAIMLGNVRSESDRYGEFRIPIRKHADTIVAALPGHIPAVVRDLDTEQMSQYRPENPLVLTLLEGSLEIAGTIFDADGEPLPEFHLSVLDPSSLSTGETVEQFTRTTNGQGYPNFKTDDDGAFRVTGLNHRNYRLRIYDSESLVNLTTNPVPAGTEDLVLALPADPVHKMVRGRVVSRHGLPVAGVDVMVGMTQVRYGASSVSTMSTCVIGGRSDFEGRFVIEILPKSGVWLHLTGEHVLTTKIELDGSDLSQLENLVVAQRCHVRLVMPESPDFDQIGFIDSDGAEVTMHNLTRGQNFIMSAWQVKTGDSPTLAIGDQADTMILRRSGKEVRRRPVRFEPGEVTLIQL